MPRKVIHVSFPTDFRLTPFLSPLSIIFPSHLLILNLKVWFYGDIYGNYWTWLLLIPYIIHHYQVILSVHRIMAFSIDKSDIATSVDEYILCIYCFDLLQLIILPTLQVWNEVCVCKHLHMWNLKRYWLMFITSWS